MGMYLGLSDAIPHLQLRLREYLLVQAEGVRA